jgi:hypothetical protein
MTASKAEKITLPAGMDITLSAIPATRSSPSFTIAIILAFLLLFPADC